MSSPHNQTGGPLQNQHQRPQRAQPLLRQFQNEYAAVDPKQFRKTGFLPPPEAVDLGLDDEGDDELIPPVNTNNYAGRGLNPFQDGFEREAYKNPELHDLPPPPGNDDLPPPGSDDLPPPPPGINGLPPPPGQDDLPGPPG